MIFRIAAIIAINAANNVIKVKDMYDNSQHDIALDNHIHFQSMPVVNDMVLYLNYDNKIFQIVKIWQVKEDSLKRKNEYLLKEGELQIQGIYGQYIYFDNNGTIKFVDSTLLNEFELSMDGFIARLKKFQLTTFDGVDITVDKDIVITRKGQAEKDDEPDFTTIINDDGINIKNKDSEIVITPQGSITIKAAKEIKLGNQLYGTCVTSGPSGSLPFCLATGAPIPGSSKVSAEK